MKKDKEKKSSLDSIFVLTIFTLFICCLLFVVLTFAGIYKSTGARIEKRFNEGTAVSLITRKLQSYDTVGAIEVKAIDGMSVLCLYESIGSDDFVTYIYCHDGNLCELFTMSDAPFDVTAGNVLFPCGFFHIDLSGNKVSYQAGENGEVTHQTVTLRSNVGKAV